MFLRFLRECVDLILPPSATERVMDTLKLDDLQRLGQGQALPYHDPRVKALVWELKYYANAKAGALCGAYLGEILLQTAGEELGKPLLVPVPMHRRRLRERGHNQTEVLCRAALPHCQDAFEYAPQALERLVHTQTQQGLPKALRVKNVKNSMRGDERVVRGRACVVVDDVTTTGATLQEAKRALQLAGARAVHVVCLARSS